MVNKSECSKNFKKICAKTLSTTKEQIRTAKTYSKLWINYATIKDAITENSKQLNLAHQIMDKKSQSVETLKDLKEEKQDELEQIKKDIQALEEKIATLESNESEEFEKKKHLQLQLLQQILLKMCTKTYIDDNKFPYLIEGFTANEQEIKVTPFEIDAGRLSEKEVQDTVWENCYQSSSFANEWQQLFEEK